MSARTLTGLRNFWGRGISLSMLGLLLAAGTAHADGRRGTESVVEQVSPLLPAPITLEKLWPDFSLVQKQPMTAPRGMKPLYRDTDWKWYQSQYGAEAARVGYQRLSSRLALSKTMLQDAQKQGSVGRVRLLCLRVFALCYQSRIGSPLAQAAVSRYMQVAHIASIVDIAPIWRMTNLLAYLGATPPADRRRYDKLAEKANVELTLQLLAAGQVSAAYRVVRRLGIHETVAVRADHKLMFQMSVARTIVKQSIKMMEYLNQQYRRMREGNPTAAMAVYLYSTIVLDRPNLRAMILQRWGRGPVGQLHQLMEDCRKDSAACYQCARTLQDEAQVLPMGILRDRVLYAALQDYRHFMDSPVNRKDRLALTLSRIAVQQVIGEGARPNPRISPLAGLVGMAPAATQPQWATGSRTATTRHDP